MPCKRTETGVQARPHLCWLHVRPELALRRATKALLILKAALLIPEAGLVPKRWSLPGTLTSAQPRRLRTLLRQRAWVGSRPPSCSGRSAASSCVPGAQPLVHLESETCF